MGAYEVYKTAQAEFCSTPCGEIENTGIHAYSIAPCLVKTETADEAIGKVAALMGIPKDSIYSSNAGNMLTSEEAGTAFALSALAAGNYHGLEIGAIQVLNDFGLLERSSPGTGKGTVALCAESRQVLERILLTFREQHRGWKERNLFEREGLMRDFRKRTGCSTEQMEPSLAALHEKAREEGLMQVDVAKDLLGRLKACYGNQYRLLRPCSGGVPEKGHWMAELADPGESMSSLCPARPLRSLGFGRGSRGRGLAVIPGRGLSACVALVLRGVFLAALQLFLFLLLFRELPRALLVLVIRLRHIDPLAGMSLEASPAIMNVAGKGARGRHAGVTFYS